MFWRIAGLIISGGRVVEVELDEEVDDVDVDEVEVVKD